MGRLSGGSRENSEIDSFRRESELTWSKVAVSGVNVGSRGHTGLRFLARKIPKGEHVKWGDSVVDPG